jgi:DNA replication licensing factor MCM3
LEAGAMVLADRGIVCIDEFDKMEEGDRVAIHEVMEQQTVTIAKAGIHTTLNARCSVVAAANPIYGEYQKDLPPTKNIGLPDSLLSRFDFIFIVLDEKNSEIDRLIAERVTKNHRYIAPGQEDNFALFEHTDDFIIEPDIHEQSTNEIFEKYNATIHDSEGELLTQRFLKKYIFYAKKTVVPMIKDEAVDFFSCAWTQNRQRENEESQSGPKTMAITIRTLETLIRIATAHAKMRLSKEVELKDCEIALELLSYALFNEGHKDHSDNEDDDEENDDFKPKSGRKSETASNVGTRSKGKQSATKDMEDLIETKEKKSETKILKKKIEAVTKKEERGAKKDSSQEKELTKKMTKISLKEDDEVENLLDQAIASEIEINEDAIKYVFREFNQLRGNRSQIPEAELWDHISRNVGSQSQKINSCLHRKEGLKKILEVLDERNKLMINKNNKTVISLD